MRGGFGQRPACTRAKDATFTAFDKICARSCQENGLGLKELLSLSQVCLCMARSAEQRQVVRGDDEVSGSGKTWQKRVERVGE